MASNQTIDRIDFAKSILDHNQHLIELADTKAGLLLATDGLILAILASAPGKLVTTSEQFVIGVTVILIGLSALFGFSTVKPRFLRGTPPTSIYFGSVVEKTREKYKEDFPSSQSDILADYLNNIYTLDLILKVKYSNLSKSVYCLLFGLVPLMAAILLLYT